jgi:hypothetical protein
MTMVSLGCEYNTHSFLKFHDRETVAPAVLGLGRAPTKDEHRRRNARRASTASAWRMIAIDQGGGKRRVDMASEKRKSVTDITERMM